MQKVKIKRGELMAAISANREKHRAIFLEAQEGYRLEVVAELERRLQDARSGKRIIRAIALPEPMDYTAEYNRVIRMLEMSVDEIVELSATEFDQFVMDNWAWKQMSLANNVRYTKSFKGEDTE
jgi:hypothetical protein